MSAPRAQRVARGYLVVIVQAVACPSTLQIGACNCATSLLFASYASSALFRHPAALNCSAPVPLSCPAGRLNPMSSGPGVVDGR